MQNMVEPGFKPKLSISSPHRPPAKDQPNRIPSCRRFRHKAPQRSDSVEDMQREPGVSTGFLVCNVNLPNSHEAKTNPASEHRADLS